MDAAGWNCLVVPDYLERKDKMTSEQYENFMNILRKVKKPGWTSDHLNFIVDSKSINENVIYYTYICVCRLKIHF